MLPSSAQGHGLGVEVESTNDGGVQPEYLKNNCDEEQGARGSHRYLLNVETGIFEPDTCDSEVISLVYV